MFNSTNSEMLIEKDSRPSGVEVSAKVCYTEFEVPNKPHGSIVMLGLALEIQFDLSSIPTCRICRTI